MKAENDADLWAQWLAHGRGGMCAACERAARAMDYRMCCPEWVAKFEAAGAGPRC